MQSPTAFSIELDLALLDCLRTVIDPEVGINIVDLGLVYLALRRNNRIVIDITLTSRACPLGEIVIADIREAVTAAFPDISLIDINLVWEPPWHPDFITETGRRQFGYSDGIL